MSFHWVKERAACSLLTVFRSLEAGVKVDIEDMKEITTARPDLRFLFDSPSIKEFSVTRMDDPINPIAGESVIFTLETDRIAVSAKDNGSSKDLFSGTITLGNDAKCKLLVNNESLEEWQVRRRALEPLFFRT